MSNKSTLEKLFEIIEAEKVSLDVYGSIDAIERIIKEVQKANEEEKQRAGNNVDKYKILEIRDFENNSLIKNVTSHAMIFKDNCMDGKNMKAIYLNSLIHESNNLTVYRMNPGNWIDFIIYDL